MAELAPQDGKRKRDIVIFVRARGSSGRLPLGQAVAERLRLVARPGADEEAQLAAARQAAPQRVGARRRLAFGPAGEDLLAHQGRGALAQELPQRFEGRGERRIRRVDRPTGKSGTRNQRPVLLRNLGNVTFKDWSLSGGSYFDKLHLARGLALGDLDNDGTVDAVISHRNAPVAILKHVADKGNHWLGIELRGRNNRLASDRSYRLTQGNAEALALPATKR